MILVLLRTGALAVPILGIALAAHSEESPADRVQEVRAFCRELAAAIRDDDAVAVARRFDAAGFVESVRAWNVAPAEAMEQLRQALPSFAARVGQRLCASPLAPDPDRVSVHRLDWRDDGTACVVLVRMPETGDANAKYRLWLRKSGGSWKLHDLADLRTGLQLSFEMAAMLSEASPERAPEWARVLGRIREAFFAFADADLDRVERLLAECEDVELPDRIEGLRQFVLAALRLDRERPAETLVHLDRVARLLPDMPVEAFLRAEALLLLERHEDALHSVRKYIDDVGPDSDAFETLSRAYRGLGRANEAIAACREGLDVEPDSAVLLAGLGAMLPAGKKAEVVERFRRLEDPTEAFFLVMETVLEEEDLETAALLVAAMRDIAPHDPEVVYYDAHLDGEAGRHARAAEKLFKVLPRVPVDEREWYEDAYAEAMVGSGRAREAYGSVPTPTVFAQVALAHEDEDDLDALAALLAAHRKRIRPTRSFATGRPSSCGSGATMGRWWRGCVPTARPCSGIRTTTSGSR